MVLQTSLSALPTEGQGRAARRVCFTEMQQVFHRLPPRCSQEVRVKTLAGLSRGGEGACCELLTREFVRPSDGATWCAPEGDRRERCAVSRV